MKKIFGIFLFLIFPGFLIVHGQKARVQIVEKMLVANSEWKILDEHYGLAASGTDYLKADTIAVSLDANRRFFLSVSVKNINSPDTILYSLLINGESVLLISAGKFPGDHLFPFFTGTRSDETKIVGGSTTRISDFPWQVYYVAANQRCGGTIISPEWIVTAAHCTKNSSGAQISPESMYIKAGTSVPGDLTTGKVYMVSEVIVHERYNDDTNENDIALLRLRNKIDIANATPVKLISPVDSVSGFTDPGVMGWISGWGMTNVSPETFPAYLQKGQVPIVSNTQASVVWRSIPASALMAGYRNGGQDACMGDSGGPLVVPVIGEYKLAGVVSWGSDKCNTYGAYTRISSFESWIRKKTGISKGFYPPVPAGDTLVCQGAASNSYSLTTVPDATSFEWSLYPSEAGIMERNIDHATVFWNPSFSGKAVIRLRITVNGQVSEWSSLDISVAKRTRLIAKSGDISECAGSSPRLFVNAEGHNLSFRWFRDEKVIQSGKANELYLLGSSEKDSGRYRCEVSGTCGTTVSDIINVTIHPLTRITHMSPDTVVSFGHELNLEVVSQGHELVYTWQKDGELLQNGQAPQLNIVKVNANHIGNYRVNVTGICGTATSETVYLFVMAENSAKDPEFLVWPTITTGQFTVAPENDQYYSISIFDIHGRFIKEIRNCRYQTSINIGNLPSGMYLINVYSRYFRFTYKVIRN